MSKHRSKQKPFKPGDYNQPTEPLESIVLPPVLDSTAPAANWPAYPPPGYQPPRGAYSPVVPRSPDKKKRPPGGAPPRDQPARRKKARKSPIPGLVGFLLVLVQIALLARVVCMLFQVQSTSLWFTLLVLTSELFVQPIRWLTTSVTIPLLAGTQLLTYLEFLVASLAYGLLARLLIRLLKALLNH